MLVQKNLLFFCENNFIPMMTEGHSLVSPAYAPPPLGLGRPDLLFIHLYFKLIPLIFVLLSVTCDRLSRLITVELAGLGFYWERRRLRDTRKLRDVFPTTSYVSLAGYILKIIFIILTKGAMSTLSPKKLDKEAGCHSSGGGLQLEMCKEMGKTGIPWVPWDSHGNIQSAVGWEWE